MPVENRLASDWEGWQADPCSDISKLFLLDLQDRLEWACEFNQLQTDHPAFGHADRVFEVLERAQKIQFLRTRIQEIMTAQQNCQESPADSRPHLL